MSRSEARDDLAVGADQKLGEIPFDALRAEKASRVLQMPIERMKRQQTISAQVCRSRSISSPVRTALCLHAGQSAFSSASAFSTIV
jgi:hypothetical protein